jgi:hypothetical protein
LHFTVPVPRVQKPNGIWQNRRFEFFNSAGFPPVTAEFVENWAKIRRNGSSFSLSISRTLPVPRPLIKRGGAGATVRIRQRRDGSWEPPTSRGFLPGTYCFCDPEACSLLDARVRCFPTEFDLPACCQLNNLRDAWSSSAFRAYLGEEGKYRQPCFLVKSCEDGVPAQSMRYFPGRCDTFVACYFVKPYALVFLFRAGVSNFLFHLCVNIF